MQIRYETRRKDFYCWAGDGARPSLTCWPHLHYHIELVYMLEGESTAYADTTAYALEAGDIFISFPNQLHQFKSAAPERYMLIIISPDIMPEMSRLFIEELPTAAVLKHADRNPHLLNLMQVAFKEGASNAPWRDNIIRGAMQAFFGELFRLLPLVKRQELGQHALQSVLNYCTRNFTRDLTLKLLEEELHLSKYYISHLFSERVGIHFNDYVNSLRISDACRLLRQTDMCMTEISDAVGFGTLRTFNRAFSKQMGLSPSEYRRSDAQQPSMISIP